MLARFAGMVSKAEIILLFTTISKDSSAETMNGNVGYGRHPEAGMLFSEAPCKDCYELIGRRTEISKTFIAERNQWEKGNAAVIERSHALPG